MNGKMTNKIKNSHSLRSSAHAKTRPLQRRYASVKESKQYA